jgi:hypothetical protein
MLLRLQHNKVVSLCRISDKKLTLWLLERVYFSLTISSGACPVKLFTDVINSVS